jgi:hypothetical protein
MPQEMLLPINDAYEAGKAYYRKHGDKLRIPYPAGSADYNEFERGWTQAQKRDSSTSSKDTERRFAREQTSVVRQPPHQTKEEIELKEKVDDYRKKSGR